MAAAELLERGEKKPEQQNGGDRSLSEVDSTKSTSDDKVEMDITNGTAAENANGMLAYRFVFVCFLTCA